jgi:hypothetical protein
MGGVGLVKPELHAGGVIAAPVSDNDVFVEQDGGLMTINPHTPATQRRIRCVISNNTQKRANSTQYTVHSTKHTGHR